SNFDPYALNQPAYAQITSIFGNPYGHGLGADIVVVSGGDTSAHMVYDTMVCGTEVSLTASEGFGSYIWDDGSSGATKTVTQSGTYYGFMLETCGAQVGRFHVRLTELEIDLGQDTISCTDGLRLLQAPVLEGATYRWQDGSTDPAFEVRTPGNFHVTVNLND